MEKEKEEGGGDLEEGRRDWRELSVIPTSLRSLADIK